MLLYVGEGRITSRLAAHTQKGRDEAHPQAVWFRDHMECSTVPLPGLSALHRLEIETDLIGSHMLEHDHPPLAQFLG
jgi:hypothetical protein